MIFFFFNTVHRYRDVESLAFASSDFYVGEFFFFSLFALIFPPSAPARSTILREFGNAQAPGLRSITAGDLSGAAQYQKSAGRKWTGPRSEARAYSSRFRAFLLLLSNETVASEIARSTLTRRSRKRTDTTVALSISDTRHHRLSPWQITTICTTTRYITDRKGK